MFERFTDRARRVVVLAQEEARLLNHNYIGTEHILLGLLNEVDGVAAQALERVEISGDAVRAEVIQMIGQGKGSPSGHIPFTPRAKKVLELSLRESLQLGHNYIGTEHILLGLIREGEGVAAEVLVKLGAQLSRVREEVMNLLNDPAAIERAATAPHYAVLAPLSTEQVPGCPRCGAPLAETLAWKAVPASGPEGEGPRLTHVTYCNRCGRALGVLPA